MGNLIDYLLWALVGIAVIGAVIWAISLLIAAFYFIGMIRG
jgi:hypothetical protein